MQGGFYVMMLSLNFPANNMATIRRKGIRKASISARVPKISMIA